MKNRVKEVRLALGLSQLEFASKIGVKRNTISQFETGVNNISDLALTSICREYNVNEEWLRTGTGDMFNVDQNNIDFLVGKYGANLNKAQKILLAMILKMDDRQRQAAEQFIEELIALRDQF